MSTFVLNREIDVENLTIQDIAKHYEAEVERYKEHVTKIGEDLEALKEEEKYCIGIIEANEKRMAEFKGYELADKFTFLDEEYTKPVIATKIRKILERCEVPFSYTLGYLQVYTFWEHPTKRIDHKMLNSTLNILGDKKLSFKGPKEWLNVLVVDSYFSPIAKEYRLNLIEEVLGAELHNVVLDAMKLQEAQGE